jgi:hypothetical protein
VHDVESFGPQVATALLSTHLPPQMWKPVLHISAHTPLTHAAVPFGSAGQLMQLVPQAVASLSGAQRVVVPVPQRWVPDAHVKSHSVPSHVVALAPVGFGHAVHDVVPHEFTLVFIAQKPLQSCVPAAHVPQTSAAPMHTPLQSFISAGQAGTHAVPSQVAVPPIGMGQAAHDEVPQLPTSLSLTHLAPQT